MKAGKIFVALSALFIIVAVVAALRATTSQASQILSPAQILQEISTQGAQTRDMQQLNLQRIRIAGKVADAEISYAVEPSFQLRFFVADRDDATKTLPVVYNGLKPDMFAAGRDVMIDGDVKNGEVVASSLLTQCPSKYEPKVAP